MASTKLPEIKILVCGRTGVGKSSLVNFILGYDVCEARGPGDGTLERVTTNVNGSQVIMNRVMVIMYDSPGLQDGTSDEPKYLAEMRTKCEDVDLVFYCLDMNTTRWTPPEKKSIQLLTETFGGAFWDKVIFVLTKGNMVRSPKGKAHTNEHFKQVKEGLSKMVRDEVKEQVQHLDVKQRPTNISNIPAIPAGSKGKQILPDGKHFIGRIWVSCIERIQLEKVDIFMQATCSDIRLVTHKDVKDVTEKSGKRWLGFIPTKEDIANAWKAVFRRANKPTTKQPLIKAKEMEKPGPIPELTTRDSDEPSYLIYLDKDDCEHLKKIPKGRVAALARMFSN